MKIKDWIGLKNNRYLSCDIKHQYLISILNQASHLFGNEKQI